MEKVSEYHPLPKEVSESIRMKWRNYVKSQGGLFWQVYFSEGLQDVDDLSFEDKAELVNSIRSERAQAYTTSHEKRRG